MRKRWLVVLILSLWALGSLGAAHAASGTVRGYVFLDSNQNGVFDSGEEGIPGVFVTVSYGDYQHTYYTGAGDANGDAPGPGSYGPTPLQPGYWKVTVHVPDGYRATSATELFATVPEDGAATGVNFGIYGSGPISYAAGTGVSLGIGGGGGGVLPQTGGVTEAGQGHNIALLVALVGLLALLGTPLAVAQAKRVD